MRQPLHQAILVDILDTPTTFARVEERLRNAPFSSANSTSIYISYAIFTIPSVGRILRIIHNIWWQAWNGTLEF
jgi:phosphoribosylpyrophosphate synthetase